VLCAIGGDAVSSTICGADIRRPAFAMDAEMRPPPKNALRGITRARATVYPGPWRNLGGGPGAPAGAKGPASFFHGLGDRYTGDTREP